MLGDRSTVSRPAARPCVNTQRCNGFRKVYCRECGYQVVGMLVRWLNRLLAYVSIQSENVVS